MSSPERQSKTGLNKVVKVPGWTGRILTLTTKELFRKIKGRILVLRVIQAQPGQESAKSQLSELGIP